MHFKFDARLERRQEETETDAQDDVVAVEAEFTIDTRTPESHDIAVPGELEIKLVLEFAGQVLGGGARLVGRLLAVLAAYPDVAYAGSWVRAASARSARNAAKRRASMRPACKAELTAHRVRDRVGSHETGTARATLEFAKAVLDGDGDR